MPTLTATYIYSGMSDYWSGDGDRWDDNKGCIFAFYGAGTTLHDLIDQLVDDFNAGGDCDSMPEDIDGDDVHKALLGMLNDRGRADYEAGALAECAEAYAEANGLSYYTGKADEEETVEHTDYAAAVAWIDKQRKTDPEGVANGEYYIDAPEDDDCYESPIYVVLLECEVCEDCKQWCDHYADDVCQTCYEKEDIAASND